jgi:hypothetical protein
MNHREATHTAVVDNLIGSVFLLDTIVLAIVMKTFSHILEDPTTVYPSVFVRGSSFQVTIKETLVGIPGLLNLISKRFNVVVECHGSVVVLLVPPANFVVVGSQSEGISTTQLIDFIPKCAGHLVVVLQRFGGEIAVLGLHKFVESDSPKFVQGIL